MSQSNHHDLIILGAGPAGLSAAIYAARAGLDVLVLEQGMPGGQIATTDEVENYPGIPHITGAELGQRFQDHADAVGARSAYAMVTAVNRAEDGLFTVSADGASYTADALVLATGAVPRPAGFEGEDTYRGRGVSYCATCDGMFYRGKDVYVIGGGNAACEEGLYLSEIVRSVTMVLRRNVFRAPQGVVDRLLAKENVRVAYEQSVTELSGGALPNAIVLRNNATGEIKRVEHPEGSFGVFVFAGTRPVTELVAGMVQTDAAGGIVTDESMATGTPGLFAAGDVRSKRLRQVITAAADGAIAATAAYQYIKGIS